MRLRYALMSVGLLSGLLVCGSLIREPQLAATNADVAASETVHARASDGLVVLYDFRSSDGAIIKDRSGVGEPADLHISDLKAVRRSEGKLEVRGKTLIRTEKPASKIIDAIRRTGAFTVETWLTPADLKQAGPARVVTLSDSPNARNVTLGQEKDTFDVRFRTTRTSTNGIPSLSSPPKSATTKLMHVVYVRDRKGRAKLYLDGKVRAEANVLGETTNWDKSFRLSLGNELSGDRPWQGTFHLVAIYDRDLPVADVERNFLAGARAEPISSARLFETRIAPLLAKHCLECHDSAVKKGKLDLSRKTAALAGGSTDKLVVPGKSSESLLWELVDSDEMPAKRPPLSADEKRALRQWIDAGAEWSVPFIDPATYALDGRGDAIWIQRLTIPEYIATVQASVGVDVSEDAHRLLPPDLRADGFKNTAYNLTVDLGHVEAYAKLAEIVTGRMNVPAFVAEHTKVRSLSESDMRKAVAEVGKWLLRGPLQPNEADAFLNVSTAVAKQGGNFNEAMSYVIEAMLQSPRFVYRIENQRGSGKARSVEPHELASRLSYIIWGASPDRELMRAADANALSDPSKITAQVQRMLRDPRAVERSAQFVSQWLDLDRLQNMRPDPKKFPKWNAQLAADMREETLAFFKDVAWDQNRPLSELFNAQMTYATPELAKHYGLDPKDNGLTKYDLSKISGRGGLLTQGSVLTVGGDEASMVARGLFVLHDVLRGKVKDPPPCVDTTPIPAKKGQSRREVAQTRVTNANCGGCHSRFEPLAYGLEKFDGLGAFHEIDEHGNKLREDGEILFPGEEKPVHFDRAAELMDILARSPRVQETITWKVTQFALGRPLVAADAPIVAKIHESAWKAGGTYADVITAVVLSDLVLKARTERNP